MVEPIEEKVSFLEDTLNRFIIHSDKYLFRMEKSIENLSREMKDFKDEMRGFKDEMKEFKDEMKDFKDEMGEFKDEMKDFKDEMGEFKDEVRSDSKTMKRQWAELANKLGSFAEDISLPNIPRIAKDFFQEDEILTIMPNVRKRNVLKRGDEYEFDGIVETRNRVFLMEAKFTARMDFVNKLPKTRDNFRAVFPEYSNKELVSIFASMSIPENILKKLTRMNIYALVLGDDNMRLINYEAIQKKKK